MVDELIEERCEVCGKVVKSHMWESGYGSHSYNHKTICPCEERRINVPERQYAFNVLVCQGCIDKEPSLHSLILKHRKEWYSKEIAGTQHKIKYTRKEIERLKQTIPEMHLELKDLRKKKKELK